MRLPSRGTSNSRKTVPWNPISEAREDFNLLCPGTRLVDLERCERMRRSELTKNRVGVDRQKFGDRCPVVGGTSAASSPLRHSPRILQGSGWRTTQRPGCISPSDGDGGPSPCAFLRRTTK